MAPRLRDEQYDEKRQRIATAAARLFAENGFAGTTNRAIAEAAGVSPGLIYWYFENKEDLFLAVFEQFARTRTVSVPPEVADTLPVAEFLRRIAETFLAGIGNPDSKALFRLVLTEVVRFPGPAQQLGALLARHPVGTLAAYFERQIARGRIEPVDPWLASQAFLGSLIGYVVRKYVFEHADLQEVDDAAMAATTSRIFAHGLVAAPNGTGEGTIDERHR